MEMTTGAILRRITETSLSVSAHKLATVILDGIAWKDGYNGLTRGTAAFTLGNLAEKMGVSRQHLNRLLVELADSSLKLIRWKSNGKFAPWLFRFGAVSNPDPDPDQMSATGDTSLSRNSQNKIIFAGKIELGGSSNVHRSPWAEMIKVAKTALPCWNVDTQVIWDRFVAFNRARGNSVVPAGFLLGFMRKWRTAPGSEARPNDATVQPPTLANEMQDLQRMIAAAPSRNRGFHAADLSRLIGRDAYETRIRDMARKHGCQWFTASLAVHGQAVLAREISR